MPVPCPCCRAANDAGPACRRCRADLTLLFAVEARRDALLADARRLLPDHPPAALAAAAEADAVRHGPDARQLAAAAALLSRDFPAAWAWYSAAGKSADRRGGP